MCKFDRTEVESEDVTLARIDEMTFTVAACMMKTYSAFVHLATDTLYDPKPILDCSIASDTITYMDLIIAQVT